MKKDDFVKHFRRQMGLAYMFVFARCSLLLAAFLTVKNIVLELVGFGGSSYCAVIPFVAATVGRSSMAGGKAGAVSGSLMILSAVAFIAFCVFCYFMSDRHYGWLVCAAVLFAIDTFLFFFAFENGCMLIGTVTGRRAFAHILICVILLIGAIIGAVNERNKPKDVPSEDEGDGETCRESQYPYKADLTVRARILASCTFLGYDVVYRRVKTTNELCVNGLVYDAYEALFEKAHCLVADIDGHIFVAGYDGWMQSYIRIDDELTTKKIRIL